MARLTCLPGAFCNYSSTHGGQTVDEDEKNMEKSMFIVVVEFWNWGGAEKTTCIFE